MAPSISPKRRSQAGTHILLPIGVVEAMRSFQISGDFTDFEIRCAEHCFKVHRIIVSSGSKYFKALCGKDFQEGSQGFVELPEEDPTILAFLITVLYHDWSLDWASICNRIQTVLAGGKRTGAGQMPTSDSKNPLDEKNYVAAAKLYAMADKFDCLEAKKWAAEIFANAVMADAFTLGDLVDAIALAYAESPENDYGLKKWVIYLAQKARPQLANLERFRSVFDASTQFAWDLRNQVCERQSRVVSKVQEED